MVAVTYNIDCVFTGTGLAYFCERYRRLANLKIFKISTQNTKKLDMFYL